MSEHGIPQIIPVPDGEKWSCLQCAMSGGEDRDADRDTLAVVLFVEGDGPLDRTGMCGNHAEVMDLEDLKEAQKQFDEEVGLL